MSAYSTVVHTNKVKMENRVCSQQPTAIRARQRVATKLMDRFIKLGVDSLEDYEIIELLFSLALPNREYKKQARKCVRKFGSLREIVDASPEELQQVGITPPAICCIRLAFEIPVKVLKQKIIGRPVYQSSQEVFDYLYYSMRGLKNEVFKDITLTEIQKVILRLYGHRHRSGKSELLMSEEVAKHLKNPKEMINDELEKLEVMGLLEVQKAFGGAYSASVTPVGLIVLDNIGPIADL